MSLAQVESRAQLGVHAPAVCVEVHLANGLPSLTLVGLPEAAVKESKDRVRAAIQNSGFEFPTRRITVNLAPADLPKEGGRFDLPIALGILAASGQLPRASVQGYECLGELALSGQLRGDRGVLSAALACQRAGRKLLIASESAAEAALCEQLDVYPALSLRAACAHLRGETLLLPQPLSRPDTQQHAWPDLSEVRGQAHAKRALEVAAAGGHNLLFVGPPGTGKTLLASRLPGILPPLNEEEALEAALIASLTDRNLALTQWRRRPYRAPHHSASAAALVGGGSQPRPGEVSLAHHGVLFLDELPEFERKVLEVLREPLEAGRVVISRATRQAEFPARFQLISAMNPCPCGHLGDALQACRCSAEQVRRYRGRLSGPLLDRIDLQVEVPRLAPEALQQPNSGESSAQVALRVQRARELQRARAGKPNAWLTPGEVERYCVPDAAGQALLAHAMRRLALSPRAYHRILKVARSIADLAQSPNLTSTYLAEAIGYRQLDRGEG